MVQNGISKDDGGAGGAGIVSNINGIETTYGKGGNGANNSGNYNGASGGVNTGNGGGGSVAASSDVSSGGNGGSGYVFLVFILEDTPCVCAGSEVLTDSGYKPIEDICSSIDRIVTSDGRRVEAKLNKYRVVGSPTNIPFIIPKDFIALNKPSKDLWISGRHGIHIGKYLTMYPLRMQGIQRDTSLLGVSFYYYHLELPDFAEDNIVCQNISIEGFSNDYFERTKKSLYAKKIKDCRKGELFYVKFVS